MRRTEFNEIDAQPVYAFLVDIAKYVDCILELLVMPWMSFHLYTFGNWHSTINWTKVAGASLFH